VSGDSDVEIDLASPPAHGTHRSLPSTSDATSDVYVYVDIGQLGLAEDDMAGGDVIGAMPPQAPPSMLVTVQGEDPRSRGANVSVSSNPRVLMQGLRGKGAGDDNGVDGAWAAVRSLQVGTVAPPEAANDIEIDLTSQSTRRSDPVAMEQRGATLSDTADAAVPVVTGGAAADSENTPQVADDSKASEEDPECFTPRDMPPQWFRDLTAQLDMPEPEIEELELLASTGYPTPPARFFMNNPNPLPVSESSSESKKGSPPDLSTSAGLRRVLPRHEPGSAGAVASFFRLLYWPGHSPSTDGSSSVDSSRRPSGSLVGSVASADSDVEINMSTPSPSRPSSNVPSSAGSTTGRGGGREEKEVVFSLPRARPRLPTVPLPPPRNDGDGDVDEDVETGFRGVRARLALRGRSNRANTIEKGSL